jgi:hypothetical protein
LQGSRTLDFLVQTYHMGASKYKTVHTQIRYDFFLKTCNEISSMFLFTLILVYKWYHVYKLYVWSIRLCRILCPQICN